MRHYRVEMQSRAYNLRSSVRQLEHAGPSVGVVSRSPARDDRDIEKLYYSVGTYPPIYIHCASETGLSAKDGYYPQCEDCGKSGKEMCVLCMYVCLCVVSIFCVIFPPCGIFRVC